MSSRNASSSPARARESVRSVTTPSPHGVSFRSPAVSKQTRRPAQTQEESNARAQGRHPAGIRRGPQGAARGGEGADPPQRRARAEAAGAPLGAGRDGLQL